MKILVASDKFKGSLTANEVCEAIAKGLSAKNKNLEIDIQALADGGDGSLIILDQILKFEKQNVDTVDPLGRKISSFYYTSENTAFIELAHASGIVLLSNKEKNPLKTSTYGTGLMIQDAIKKGYNSIFLLLGGSATNDAGTGIASALGWKFLNKNREELKTIGENLVHINTIVLDDDSLIKNLKITLLYDVTNPLYGPDGSAFVYASQKGASKEDILSLDQGLRNINKVLLRKSNIDVNLVPGVGAAGGTGASLIALCKAKMEIGFNMISKLTDLENKIKHADIIISGEGKLDKQSFNGKVVYGVSKFCKMYQKSLYLFVGKNELNQADLKKLGVKEVFSILDYAKDSKDAFINGSLYLEEIAKQISFQ